MNVIIEQGLIFGAIFSLVIGLSYLVYPRRTVSLYMIALLHGCAVVIFFYAYWNYVGFYFDNGVLNHLYVPFIYFIGPCLYFMFRDAAEEDFRVDPIKFTVFAPGVLLLIAFPLIYLAIPAAFQDLPIEYFRGRAADWLEVLIVVGFAINIVYYWVLYNHSSVAFNRESLRREESVRILLIILLSVLVMTGIIVAAYLLRDETLFFYTAFATVVITATNYIMGRRRPDLFADLSFVLEEARQAQKDAGRYQTSRLDGVDLKGLQKNLDRLMREEKIYLEDDLTLKKLAEEAGVKHYQLSEFLNARLHMNFA